MLDWTHLECLQSIADAYAAYYGARIGDGCGTLPQPRLRYFYAICAQRA